MLTPFGVVTCGTMSLPVATARKLLILRAGNAHADLHLAS